MPLRPFPAALILLVAAISAYSTYPVANQQSAIPPLTQQNPSSPEYLTTFTLADRCKSFGPWVLSPSNNSRTVWVGTYQLGQPYSGQVVNFTLDPQLGQFQCTIATTLKNTIPESIAFDLHSGKVWFTYNDTLAYINPINGTAQTARTFSGGSPSYIAIDPTDDNLWLTLPNSNRIAEFIPLSNQTYFTAAPASSAGLQGISIGPGGVWFAEAIGRLGRLTPCGSSSCPIQDFSPPPGITLIAPTQVTVDAKGLVWFTEHGSNQFGSLDPSTNPPRWSVYPVGYCNSGYCSYVLPNAIFPDSQGRIWFSEHIAGRIAVYNPSSMNLIEYTIPTTGDTPASWWTSPGRNNQIWFTAYNLGQIGYVNASLPVPIDISQTMPAITVQQGHSFNIQVRVVYQGQGTFYLGILPSTDDSAFFSSSSSPGPYQASGGSSTESVTISTAWNATLGTRRLALTAFSGSLAVSAHILVTVLDASLPYVTLGFVSMMIVGSLLIVVRRRRSRKLVPAKRTRR